MANDYTTSTDAFADISEASYSSSDYPAMASFVTAASRLIDAEFGRWAGFFYPTTDEVTRYYDGYGIGEQIIDEFASITTVSVSEQGGLASTDYTDWSSSDYVAEPYNYSQLGRPVTKLVIDPLNGSQYSWPTYRRAVRVVGIAGYSLTTPEIIAQACRIQSVRWFMRAKGGYQDVTGNDETGRLYYKGSTELDADVKLLLWPLKLELD